METADLDTVMELEIANFPSSPWKRSFFEHELASEESICEVTTSDDGQDSVTGYIICYKVMDELHVMNIAVREDMKRRGIGTLLLKNAISQIGDGLKNVYLEVRKSNEPALRLYEKLGFNKIGIRRKYYQDSGEDAIVMGLAL